MSNQNKGNFQLISVSGGIVKYSRVVKIGEALNEVAKSVSQKQPEINMAQQESIADAIQRQANEAAASRMPSWVDGRWRWPQMQSRRSNGGIA